MTKLGPGSIKTEKVYRVYIFMSIIKNRSLHSSLGPKFPGFYNSLRLDVIRKFYLLLLDIYFHHYLVFSIDEYYLRYFLHFISVFVDVIFQKAWYTNKNINKFRIHKYGDHSDAVCRNVAMLSQGAGVSSSSSKVN